MKTLQTLQSLREAALRPFRHAENRTFVCFQAEDQSRTVAPVTDRDPKKLTIPENTTALFFFEHGVKPGDNLTDKGLLRDAKNFGSAYYFADRILSQADFRAMDDEQKRGLTGFDGPNKGEHSHLAVDGKKVRYVNNDWEHDIIILDRKTHEQLWPKKPLPGLPVVSVPKP